MASSPPWSLISLTNSTYHEDYHPLSEVDHFVDELLEQHPDLVTRASIGHSSEGREMYALTISKARTEAKAKYAKKTGFLLTGAQHAREVRYCLSLWQDPTHYFSMSVDCNIDCYVPHTCSPVGSKRAALTVYPPQPFRFPCRTRAQSGWLCLHVGEGPFVVCFSTHLSDVCMIE